jgi:aminoglycoside phosphotransferase (APT) family kinase protein
VTLSTTANDLVHYLVERGLLTAGQVVGGRLVVAPAARRNNNFSVVGGGASYFAKSVIPGTAQAAETLRQEAALYALVTADEALAPMRELLPRYYLYDPQRSLLVLEYLERGRTVTEMHNQLGAAPEWIAERIGAALAAIHRAGAAVLPRTDAAAFKRQPPWALSLHQIVPSFGQTGMQLQTLLLTWPEFTQALDAMRGGWRINTLIHGDMKFDNCLLVDRDAQEPALRIIDWELADAGEDLWDVAGILQNYLFWSAVSTTSDQSGWTVTMPFEKLQPAMRALWSSYCSALGTPAEEMAPRLERCAAYAAARLLQSVTEMLVVSPVMSSHVALLLQTSLNILRDPPLMARLIVGTETAAHA